MINFELTEEQRAIRNMARDFATKEIRPVAGEYDEREEIPWDVVRKAHEVGLTTYHIPEEYGGGGVLDMLTNCIVNEELYWGCAGIASSLHGPGLALPPILGMATPEQKKRFLPPFCGPEPRLGCMGLTEPGAGSDAASLSTTATREGDFYILNGTKIFITNGGISKLHVIFATVDKSLKHKGIACFVLEEDTPGLRQGKKEKKLGIRASHTAELILEDCKVPAANMLGEPGTGFYGAMQLLDRTRPMVASGAVGVARASYEYALDYARTRVQFGKPIIAQQAVGFMLADMAMQVEAARLLMWEAAWQADQRMSSATTLASMAKAFAGDVAMKVSTDAVQVLGGYGYIREHPVEKWMRDAKIMQIYEGTAQIQRLVIARRISGMA